MVMLGVGLCIIIGIILVWRMTRPNSYSIRGRHVLITGGSSGIGLELAIEARKRGANVTIVARNSERLEQAKDKILQAKSQQEETGWVQTISLDITTEWTKIREAMDALVEAHGPVHVLINCAGYAVAHYFEDATQQTFDDLMRLNYSGSVAVTHALLPAMRKCSTPDSGGCITFVSSMAGQVGVFGYTGYSASKFALRGLAEVLHWELLNDGISVTMAFPPDTNTPAYEREQEGKPAETVAISEAGGLLQPNAVARKVLQDTLDRRFFSGFGLEGWMLCLMTAGMAPTDSFVQALIRAVCCGILHLVAFAYRMWMRCVIRAHADRKTLEAKKEE